MWWGWRLNKQIEGKKWVTCKTVCLKVDSFGGYPKMSETL